MSGIELQGIDTVLAELRRRLGNGASRVENKALREAGQPMAEAMQSKVNVSDEKRRHLREDIRVSRVVRKDGMKYVLVGPGRKTGWRAHFLEYGTSKMSAQPFVEPSFHEKKGESLQILADGFRKGLKE